MPDVSVIGSLWELDTAGFPNLPGTDYPGRRKTITEGILSIRINGGSSSEDDFSLGSAVSRYVKWKSKRAGMRFEGYEFSLELGLNGEYIPMGYFTGGKTQRG